MKRFTSVFTEGNAFPTTSTQKSVTADIQPGNAYPGNGVANHYTPIENILINVRNLYSTHLGIVASIAEDGVSLKLNSTKFVTKENVNKVLFGEWFDNSVYNHSMSLGSYIQSQGLDKVTLVELGQYIVVYFSPSDMMQVSIPASKPGANDKDASVGCTCTEMLQFGIDDAEIDTIIEAADDDEEILDATKKEIKEILASKDKVKAAKQLGVIIGNHVELPQDYYSAGINIANDGQAIALRWKYLKKRPHNKTTEIKRTLIYFFEPDSKEPIWVGDFDKDTMFTLPDEVKKLIENILDIIGAKKTNDPCVFVYDDSKQDDEDKKDDKDKEDNKEEDKKSNDDKKDKDDEEDVENDSSRDESDDLL